MLAYQNRMTSTAQRSVGQPVVVSGFLLLEEPCEVSQSGTVSNPSWLAAVPDRRDGADGHWHQKNSSSIS